MAFAAAAFLGHNSNRNGVAPGAQIISITVCDPRFGCSANVLAVEKALSLLKGYDCDIINFSCGPFVEK